MNLVNRICLLLAALTLCMGCAHERMQSEKGKVPTTQPTTQPTRRHSSNSLGNPPNMVDKLGMFDTPETLGTGTRRAVNLVTTAPVRLEMIEPGNRQYPRKGEWMSEEEEAGFGFTELIPSWNVNAPPQTGVRFDVRTRDAASQVWSPWLYVGDWGKVSNVEKRVTSDENGKINVDTLMLWKPADAWQMRATFQSFDTNVNVNPSVRRVAVAYSGVVDDPKKREKLLKDDPPTTAPAGAINLAVPFRAQGDTPKALRGQTCSPTSTTMVMAYWGVDRPIVENCVAIWDDNNDLFGNWARAVARAGEMGLDAWVARFRNWDQVRVQLAEGTPVIASIKFKPGEFPSSILKDGSPGHLIVIRGMTEKGDLIVNDPANRAKGNGPIYKADEFAHAWFDHGGVGYVIKGKKPATQPTIATTRPNGNIVMGK